MVKLVTVSKNHFELDYAGGTGIKVTPEVTLTDAAAKKADAKVTVELWMVGDAEAVTVTIDGQQKETPVENGYAKAVFGSYRCTSLGMGVDESVFIYGKMRNCLMEDSVETTFGMQKFFH